MPETTQPESSGSPMVRNILMAVGGIFIVIVVIFMVHIYSRFDDLEREQAIGDLNKHSELIATSHDELEMLKHRGDRNYFEFTLTKGKQPTHVGTVNLELKKADPKKSKFTLYVMADDKKIEKKDRNINEPLQFYTGRDHNLYEVVINSVDNKNQITGYLSTPKSVAVEVRQN